MTPLNIHPTSSIKLVPLGEKAIIVQFSNIIDESTHKKVKAFVKYLEDHPFPGFIECVPAFTSVTVYYDLVSIYNIYKERSPYQMVHDWIDHLVTNMEDMVDHPPRVVEIPVCYGGEFGPDLHFVAEHNQLTESEVIDIHSKEEYLVYMIGFAPGFPYLGGMSERISAPRRPTPRMSIPAGSVGIAGLQTGVYPIATPGGWQLIGRTPVELFRPNENPPSFLQAGDIIRFRPISLKEYEEYIP